MKTKHLVIIITISVITLFFTFLMMMPKPIKVVDKPTNILNLQHTIDSLNQLILSDKAKLSGYQHTIDSLNTLPPQIIIKYREKKAVIPTATVSQLDSIIRANTGL